MDNDFILFGLCMWSAVATGLALTYYRGKRKAETLLIIMAINLSKLADGEVEIFRGEDGSVRTKEIENGISE